MKVSALKREKLDYWVAKAIAKINLDYTPIMSNDGAGPCYLQKYLQRPFDPTNDQNSIGFQMCQRERIALIPCEIGWKAEFWYDMNGVPVCILQFGENMLEAGLRCLVEKHYGEDVPDEYDH